MIPASNFNFTQEEMFFIVNAFAKKRNLSSPNLFALEEQTSALHPSSQKKTALAVLRALLVNGTKTLLMKKKTYVKDAMKHNKELFLKQESLEGRVLLPLAKLVLRSIGTKTPQIKKRTYVKDAIKHKEEPFQWKG